MHILPQSALFDALQNGEKLFLEAWFNLTHERSLDSFRVRCHNGRTILAELRRESAFSFSNTEDIAVIAVEAKVICSLDTVLKRQFGSSWAVVENLVTALANKAAKDESAKERTRLEYVLADTLPNLPQLYLSDTIAALQVAIAGNYVEEIVRLTSALATELAARGWAMASLHTWTGTHFLKGEPTEPVFTKRFGEFADRIKRPPQTYDVTVSLSGNAELQKLGTFVDFTFSENPPAISGDPATSSRGLEKFLRKNPHRVFAITSVEAVDPHSAAHAALEKFAICQDRLRFNFSPEPVVGWSAVLVTRRSDGKHKIRQAEFRIPSPEHHLKLSDFLATNRNLDELFRSEQTSTESRRRIESALRHYRLGLDGRTYRDMLLNWWMGLETLTNAGEGKGIGARVFKNSLPLLTHRYLEMQLRHLSTAVHAACGKWPAEIAAALKAEHSASLSASLKWEQVLALLQDAPARAAIESALDGHPWVKLRWLRFAELAGDPQKLLGYLEEHEQRVRWHLIRLYRLRCCLVHGTPIEMPLQLPTANLEYYLREAIYVTLGTLLRARQISSLDELFERANDAASRRRAALAEKGAKPSSIPLALGMDLVFQLSA